MWRGPALADVSAPFAGSQAARLEEARASAVEQYAEARLRIGDPGAVVAALRDLVDAQPLRERARALLMRALHGGGRQAEALAVFEEGRRVLADELGADPSKELADVHLAILRGDPLDEAPDEAPAVRADLPAQLTSFVGREEELRRVGKMLASGRLVTLLGPGGAGKTRLAIEAAGREDGEVHFVDLAPVVASEVPKALLGALGLREGGMRPAPGERPPGAMERLVTALDGRRALLVLDNCEHVVEAVAGLAHRLLSACPRLRVLATSREALAITGEAVWPLPPLEPPPEGAPGRGAARRIRRCGCSSTGPRRCVPASRWTRRTPAPWCGSAGRWTGCRWRSSWPRRGCGRCRSPRSRPGWTTGSGSCRAGTAPRRRATRRSAGSSSGAGTCWTRRSGPSRGASRCSPAASRWRRRRASATSTTPTSCSSSWPTSRCCRATAPGTGCSTPSARSAPSASPRPVRRSASSGRTRSTSPASPRARTPTCAAPGSSNGWNCSPPTTGTCTRRCGGPSGAIRRSRSG
ncbi:AfsR/SARP family transcriptional regulator [Actinomadura madurae]|uniref:AfsR/SARP family transcriptional regulator n=1 Tax=Actinomadura madurae TaxID=1993 RepID=UPI003556A6B9